MPNIIQHLRADRDGWAQNDIIPKDGELALLKTEDGGTFIKIGDGEHRFSELTSLTGEVSNKSGESLVLRHGEEARYGTLPLLYMTFPQSIREDYYASVSFDSPSGSTPTSFVYPETPKIYFSGDDVIDGVFVPDASKHYSLFFWYDGRMQGLVRRVDLETI